MRSLFIAPLKYPEIWKNLKIVLRVFPELSDYQQARNEFRFYFKDALTDLTGGGTTSSISYGNCGGNIEEGNYKMSPLSGIIPHPFQGYLCIAF